MGSLYVAYSAKRDNSVEVTGWITLKNTGDPQSTADIQSICKKIATVEGLYNVIPSWWRELAQE